MKRQKSGISNGNNVTLNNKRLEVVKPALCPMSGVGRGGGTTTRSGRHVLKTGILRGKPRKSRFTGTRIFLFILSDFFSRWMAHYSFLILGQILHNSRGRRCCFAAPGHCQPALRPLDMNDIVPIFATHEEILY